MTELVLGAGDNKAMTVKRRAKHSTQDKTPLPLPEPVKPKYGLPDPTVKVGRQECVDCEMWFLSDGDVLCSVCRRDETQKDHKARMAARYQVYGQRVKLGRTNG